jgi:hypothetical protein
MQRSLARLKVAAAARGYAPEFDLQHPVAPGQMLKGYVDAVQGWAAGAAVGETRADAAQLEEFMRAAAAAMAEELPRAQLQREA